MEKKERNIMIISIIALSLVLIGVTFAYFSARITGLESASTINSTAGRMGIIYSEGDENVTVSNIYPRSEEWLTKTITLTGYNTTNKPMEYDLGLNITSNTFKGGQLTLSLTGVGFNGTKIADITSKSITGQNKFFKIGTGTFNQSNGDTHVYTLKIYFKDNGKDQNINQDAVFNAKIHIRDAESNSIKALVDTSNQNHNGKHCYTNDYVANQTPANGTTYENGQYSYRYNMYMDYSGWMNDSSLNGWGVTLTDKTSTDPVTTELCAYINEKPVKRMDNMFYQSQATSIDLSSFDTSNVTNMAKMFWASQATTITGLTSFDTSNVTNMYQMFAGSYATTIDVSSFDTSSVTDMAGMFYYAYSVSSLDLSNFDTSNVTDMSYVFYHCAATSIDLSSFDTSKVTDMSHMFEGSPATILDLSGFDTSSVTNMYRMFLSNSSTSIDLSSFDTSNVTDMSDMFYQSVVTDLDFSSFNTSKVTNMERMFQQSLVTSLDLSSFDTSNVTNMEAMFYLSHATTLNLTSFDTSKVTDMSSMFQQSMVDFLDLSSFDTSKVTAMYAMFWHCPATNGYARTQADADRFNDVPGSLSNGSTPGSGANNITFVVK